MFSTKLSDLDDFLQPSQECVKMIVPNTTPEDGSKGTAGATAKVQLDANMVLLGPPPDSFIG